MSEIIKKSMIRLITACIVAGTLILLRDSVLYLVIVTLLSYITGVWVAETIYNN